MAPKKRVEEPVEEAEEVVEEVVEEVEEVEEEVEDDVEDVEEDDVEEEEVEGVEDDEDEEEDGEVSEKRTQGAQSAKERKKQQRKKLKQDGEKIVSMLRKTFKVASLVGKKPNGINFDRRKLVNVQTSMIHEVQRYIADVTRRPKPANDEKSNRNTNYPRPMFFTDSLVAFIEDIGKELTNSKEMKTIQCQVNDIKNPDRQIDYAGQAMRDVLVLCSKASLEVDGKKINLKGLASKEVVITFLNLYISYKNLKGVEAPWKDKDGTIKMKKKMSYWSPDALMRKHFGPILEELVEKTREKDENVTIDRMTLGAVMALQAKLADSTRNTSEKEILKSEKLLATVSHDAEFLKLVKGKLCPTETRKKK